MATVRHTVALSERGSRSTSLSSCRCSSDSTAPASTLRVPDPRCGGLGPDDKLEVYAQLDEGTYPDKIRVTDAEIKAVNLHGHEFHPEWNYCIKPRC